MFYLLYFLDPRVHSDLQRLPEEGGVSDPRVSLHQPTSGTRIPPNQFISAKNEEVTLRTIIKHHISLLWKKMRKGEGKRQYLSKHRVRRLKIHLSVLNFNSPRPPRLRSLGKKSFLVVEEGGRGDRN